MRLALVATPAPQADLRPTPGPPDGHLTRARPPLPNRSSEVIALAPGAAPADQLEAIFARRCQGEAPPEASEATAGPVLFYASCRSILSVEGELFLALDP